MNINLIESIRHFFQKNTVIFLISVSVVLVALLILFSYLLNPIQGQWATVIIMVAGIWLFGYLNRLGFKRKNVLKGLQYASPVLIGSLYSLVLSIVYVKQYKLYIPGIYRIISIVFQMLAIGFFEEILFRGILLNTIIYIFNKKKKSVYCAVIISSIIFGLCHLSNLINRPHILIGTISQVLYSTMIGILYSIVYIKYRNILSIIIIHTLFNLMSVFPFTFLDINYWLITYYFTISHSKLLIALCDCILMIPCLIYILYLIKRLEIKIEKIK
jgi:membrane protease YdiL (CAAX protease family)